MMDTVANVPRRGRFMRMEHITREYMRTKPDTLFVMGDNMKRTGKAPSAGQAAEMRDEPNTVGIPTKRFPAWNEKAFFTDADWNKEAIRNAIVSGFDRLEEHLKDGKDVIISSGGIGTGKAQLKQRAPVIWNYVQHRIEQMETLYGAELVP